MIVSQGLVVAHLTAGWLHIGLEPLFVPWLFGAFREALTTVCLLTILLPPLPVSEGAKEPLICLCPGASLFQIRSLPGSKRE